MQYEQHKRKIGKTLFEKGELKKRLDALLPASQYKKKYFYR